MPFGFPKSLSSQATVSNRLTEELKLIFATLSHNCQIALIIPLAWLGTWFYVRLRCVCPVWKRCAAARAGGRRRDAILSFAAPLVGSVRAARDFRHRGRLDDLAAQDRRHPSGHQRVGQHLDRP